ncbi:MAG TPA: DUF962 domain-containing protein [Micropepsaceae bacterium]|nr:DUF962 domain-containing protein [Micropepsaceae bacterium]
MASSNPQVINSYRTFWPHYLQEHAMPLTRNIHIAGTLAAIALLIASLVLFNGWLVVAALAAGYGPAFTTHYLIEKNRPLTLRHPLWSFAADIHMTFAWLSGRLTAELRKAGVAPQ